MLEYLILNNRLEAAYKYYDQAPKGYRQQLLFHFNKGNRMEFFKVFALLQHEEKLQFYIRVYFLVYSIHPNLKAKNTIPQEQINAFKTFLDTRGADLAKTNQFLQFYALPFVKRPLEHASFKQLFKKEWVDNLTEKLQLFIDIQQRRMRECVNNLKGKQQSESKKFRSPSFNQPVDLNTPGIKTLQQKNKRLFEQLQGYKAKFSNLEKNNQALIESFNWHLMQSQNKWFQITRQLTNNARTLIQMIARSSSPLINDRKYQRIKRRTQKFQKIVKKQLEQLLNQSQDLSVFDKPSINQASHSASFTPNISQRNLTGFATLEEFVPTNYVALMKDFKKMNDQQKNIILQGFSWRIIKCRNKWIRRQTIVGLIVNDVLGIMNGDIQDLLFSPQTMIHTIQLFLYISEDLYGSKVLFRNGGLYKQIIDLIPHVLHEKQFECLEGILEILQNIWHNKQIQLELINLNMIDICVNQLLADQTVRQNSIILESISTLLLNASAVKEGLDSIEQQVNIYYYLSQAYKAANESNRNLIGAIIYALLGRKQLWKLAHEAKLPNFVDDLLRLDHKFNKQQLVLLQQKLLKFQPGKTISSDQYEDDSIDSNLQEQIFERNEEEIADLEDYIKGHETLLTKYSLKNKQAEKQIDQINKIMQKFKNKTESKIKNQQQKTNNLKINPTFEEKEKLRNVRLPEIKAKKDESKNTSQRYSKQKYPEQKDYYSYKSPNYKNNNEHKNAYSIQVDANTKDHVSSKQRIHSFQVVKQQQDSKIHRVQQKVSSNKGLDSKIEEIKKKAVDKKSVEKPQYRIKKSSSVEKGIGLGNLKRPEIIYETNKNNSNVQYKNVDSLKSPPQRKPREEVLKQLNQELKAERKAQEKDRQRKVSVKNIPATPNQPERQNAHLKKVNNFIEEKQGQITAFIAKPKLKRTPPRQDE